MTMNRIIPIIGGIVLLIAIAVAIRSGHRKPEPSMMSSIPKPPEPDADTPADTVRTLSAKVSSLLDQTRRLAQENQRLRREANENRVQEDRIVAKVRSRLSSEIERAGNDNPAVESLKAEIGRLRSRLSELGSRSLLLPKAKKELPVASPDLPAGFGFEGAQVRWIEPLGTGAPGIAPDGTPVAASWQGRGTKNGSLLRSSRRSSERGEAAGGAARGGRSGRAIRRALRAAKPVYTIPANSTLLDSTAFTALVGRVPVGGQVQDPMPFKVLVGADNLAANGHRIPGLRGIVMSGYAVGDWTLSCVRGYLTSALFVFEDGHVVVFGGKKRSQNKNKNDRRIGWISDRFGVPCVAGKRVTNAPAFLAQRIGVMGLKAAAEAAAAAQTTTWSSPVQGTSGTTVDGDKSTYVLGKTLSGAAGEVGNWLEERQANSFDAIFAPAGTRVAVHIETTLPIDYDPAGRMLDRRAAAIDDEPGGGHGYLD